MSDLADGIAFLKFLVEKGYMEEVTAKINEMPDLNRLLDDMYKTQLLTESKCVAYLNEWGKLKEEVVEVTPMEVSLPMDVVEDHDRLSKYYIVPISISANNASGQLNTGGLIKFLVPYSYHNVVNKDYIRRALKPVHQTSAWQIELLYGLGDPVAAKYYDYAKKFIDSSIAQIDSLSLRQKLMKVFRDAVSNKIMDVVFLVQNSNVTIKRKFMDEFFTYDKVKFKPEEARAIKSMLAGTLGPVPASVINSEPAISYVIRNLIEDGNYEGRVEQTDIRDGYQIHIRIVNLQLHSMTFDDYYLTPYVKQALDKALWETRGLVIYGGPRGSGKQVFIYTSINEFRERRPNTYIESLEDPIEAVLDGVAQIQVEEHKGYGFSYYGKAFKRHSTNLYFIGELRDRETVEVAVTETVSGALLFTTTHISECAGIFKKLGAELKDDDMVIKLTNEFRLVTNLTMSREVCPKCVKQVTSKKELSTSEIMFLQSWRYNGRVFKANEAGCDYCKSYNYNVTNKLESIGNLAKPLIIVEGLSFDKEVLEICNKHYHVNDRENAVRKFMIDNNIYKSQVALSIMHQGKLSIQECMRLFPPNIYTN